MATFLLGMTRMGKVRKEYVRGTAQVERSGEREARLRLFGRAQEWIFWANNDEDEEPGRRKTGRRMYVVKEDMQRVCATE